MAIPKSAKAAKEDAVKVGGTVVPTFGAVTVEPEPDTYQIRPIECLNDYVAIQQFQIETTLALASEEQKYKNEGIVVGVGPGNPDGAGGRLKPSVEVGDVVMFGERNIIAKIQSDKPPYQGKNVILMAERNILCKLPRKVTVELVD